MVASIYNIGSINMDFFQKCTVGQPDSSIRQVWTRANCITRTEHLQAMISISQCKRQTHSRYWEPCVKDTNAIGKSVKWSLWSIDKHSLYVPELKDHTIQHGNFRELDQEKETSGWPNFVRSRSLQPETCELYCDNFLQESLAMHIVFIVTRQQVLYHYDHARD